MIIYLGNMLSRHGKAASVIEMLGPKLGEFIEVKSYSAKRSQRARLIEMLVGVWLHRRNVSLVLIDAFSSRAFWYTYLIARLCVVLKIPFVPILHGGDFPNRLRRSPRLTRFVFSHSAINISPSRYLQEHFEKAGYAVKYIPNFLDISLYTYSARASFVPHMLWVRSFHALYNPVLAIEALAEIKKQYPSATLTMVGPDKDGSLAMVRKKALDLGVGNAVTYTGLLSKSQWIEVSKHCDTFVNTTNFDNMPVSVIEAMALGLPVVSTNVGGLPYLLTHGVDGLLVPPASPSAFAKAVVSLVDNPGLGQQLAVRAREKATGFDWGAVRAQWIEVIDTYRKRVQ